MSLDPVLRQGQGRPWAEQKESKGLIRGSGLLLDHSSISWVFYGVFNGFLGFSMVLLVCRSWESHPHPVVRSKFIKNPPNR